MWRISLNLYRVKLKGFEAIRLITMDNKMMLYLLPNFIWCVKQ